VELLALNLILLRECNRLKLVRDVKAEWIFVESS